MLAKVITCFPRLYTADFVHVSLQMTLALLTWLQYIHAYCHFQMKAKFFRMTRINMLECLQKFWAAKRVA